MDTASIKDMPLPLGMKERAEAKKANIKKIKHMLLVACQHLGMTKQRLMSRNRKRELVTARYLLFLYFMRRGYKSVEIQKAMLMDHTTILYGTQTMKSLTETYPELELKYRDLEKHIDDIIKKEQDAKEKCLYD